MSDTPKPSLPPPPKSSIFDITQAGVPGIATLQNAPEKRRNGFFRRWFSRKSVPPAASESHEMDFNWEVVESGPIAVDLPMRHRRKPRSAKSGLPMEDPDPSLQKVLEEVLAEAEGEATDPLGAPIQVHPQVPPKPAPEPILPAQVFDHSAGVQPETPMLAKGEPSIAKPFTEGPDATALPGVDEPIVQKPRKKARAAKQQHNPKVRISAPTPGVGGVRITFIEPDPSERTVCLQEPIGAAPPSQPLSAEVPTSESEVEEGDPRATRPMPPMHEYPETRSPDRSSSPQETVPDPTMISGPEMASNVPATLSDDGPWDEGTAAEWRPRPGPTPVAMPSRKQREGGFQSIGASPRKSWLYLGGTVGVALAVVLGITWLSSGTSEADVPRREIPASLRGYHTQAEAGDVAAMRMLGLRYIYGINAPMDRSEGVRWLRKAVKAGSTSAKQELAALGVTVQ